MVAHRVKKLGMAALVAVMTSAPVAAVAESLSDALVSAYRSSGLLNQQRALLRATDEDVAVAVAATRPVISYALGAGWTRTRITTTGITRDEGSLSASLNATLTLYDFGRNDLNIEMAKETVLLTREMLVGVEQNVLLRAVKAFLDVRSAHETAMLQANNVRLITQELRAAKDRFEVGEITQTDVSLAEARLAGARAQEASARGNLMIAREEYKAAIGHYPNGLSVPPRVPMTARTLEAAKAQARARHPEVKAAQRGVTVAEMGTEMARRAPLPSLDANASLTGARTYSDNGTGIPPAGTVNSLTGKVGVTLSGPIYSGGRLAALYRKANAQAAASRFELHTTVMGVEQNVGNAWAQLAIASASLEATERQIRAARVALRGAREEAKLGARTTLEVLNYEQELLDAEATRIEAQSGQYIAAYNLLAAMGLLTADHLKLGIATYDPEPYYNAVKSAPVYVISPQGERLESMLEAISRSE